MEKLLTRNEFRDGVFKRDHSKCVICRKDANERVIKNECKKALE